MEVIRSNRGGQKICLDGYMYTKKKESNNCIMWRCVERKGVVPCSASMKTNLAMENLQLLKIHNHQAVPGRVDVVKARGQMKARARSSLDKPNQIFVNTNANMTEDAKALLATPETIRRDLRRTRAAHHPVEPQTLRDLEILGQWALTVGINPEALVLHDSGRDSNERIIIFAKNGHVQKLAECDKWCMDGNFAVAPPLFLQLYVILGRVAGSFVPLVYALLELKLWPLMKRCSRYSLITIASLQQL